MLREFSSFWSDQILWSDKITSQTVCNPTGVERSSSIRERQSDRRFRLVSSICRLVGTVRRYHPSGTGSPGSPHLRRDDTGFISQTGCVRFPASHASRHTSIPSDIGEQYQTAGPSPASIHFAHGVSHPSEPPPDHNRPRSVSQFHRSISPRTRGVTANPDRVRQVPTHTANFTPHTADPNTHDSPQSTRESHPALPHQLHLAHGESHPTPGVAEPRFTSQTGCVRHLRPRPPEPPTSEIDFASGSR